MVYITGPAVTTATIQPLTLAMEQLGMEEAQAATVVNVDRTQVVEGTSTTLIVVVVMSNICVLLTLTLPGFCWKWLDCFKGCCNEMNIPHGKQQANVMTTFCGDGTCTVSKGETPSSCPIDCCYLVNSTCSNTLT